MAQRPGTLAFGFLAMLVSATVAAAVFQQTGSGMVGYWPGDDGPGPTTALDQSGNGTNGTYTNGATTNSASKAPLLFPNPSSMSFSGGTDYVNIPGVSWPSGGPVTVSFWNLVATADVKNSSAFTVGNMDTPNRFQCHAPWSDSNIYWDYGSPTNGSGRVSTSYTAYLNAWTHIALVSDGTGGTFQGIYLNGTLAASVTTSAGPTVALSGAQIGSWTGPGLYEKGLIDDFRIYNRVLTAAEITSLAAGNSGPAAPTTLTATPGNQQVSLSWAASAGPGTTVYNVKRSTVMGGSPPGTYTTIASDVSTTAYVDTGLTNGTTYYYVVSAVSFGEGPISGEANATPVAPPPHIKRPSNTDARCGCGTAGAGDQVAIVAFLIALSALALSRRT